LQPGKKKFQKDFIFKHLYHVMVTCWYSWIWESGLVHNHINISW